MKIALLGYGRMGKEIEKIALERGHEIVLKKTQESSFEKLEQSDVAIDFSIPSAAVENITQCIKLDVPVVSGTTGWLESYEEIVNKVNASNGAFIYASNFSIGVNIFFELNKKLASLITPHKQYHANIEEIHHTQKLDAPSGTAITLAEDIISLSDYNRWSMSSHDENSLLIEAKRIPDVPGTHIIEYSSEIDTIEIKHTAHNRKGFALGAVIAAEWLQEKKGVFSMKDVLDLG